MARRTLSNETKQGILDGLKNGVSPVSLAQQFGVSIPTIYNYRKSQLVVTTGANLDNLGTGTSNVELATVAPVATRAARKSSTKASR